MPRFINPVPQYFTANGAPLVSGTLHFYDSGSATYKNIWCDSARTTLCANPVTLYGDGRIPSIFLRGTYRVVLQDSSGATIWERDPVSGNTDAPFGADWSSDVVYESPDVVQEDGKYWTSIASGNIGNRPSTDGGVNWTEVVFLSATSGTVQTTVVTASDPTWTPTSGVKAIEFLAIGGGGGAGGIDGQGAGTSAAGGGGGGAASVVKTVTTIDASYNIVIGAGGAGGAGTAGVSGSAGGTTTITSGTVTVSAGGGSGGTGMVGTSGSASADGGAAGTGTGGDYNLTGSGGGVGLVNAGGYGAIGAGGSAILGGGGRPVINIVGINGGAYGAGGGAAGSSGAAADRAGGSGANGVVIITEYF